MRPDVVGAGDVHQHAATVGDDILVVEHRPGGGRQVRFVHTEERADGGAKLIGVQILVVPLETDAMDSGVTLVGPCEVRARIRLLVVPEAATMTSTAEGAEKAPSLPCEPRSDIMRTGSGFYPDGAATRRRIGMEQQEPRTASGAELDVSSSVRAGLSPVEAAGQLRQWITEGNNYSRVKKQSFRRWSSTIRVASLLMSAAATIILGLQNLDFWAGLGFSLVALTTVTNGSEAFFNWRSRWVFAEEAQYRLYRLQDDLDYLVAKKAPDALTFDDLDPLYTRYQEVWERFSVQWLEERRRGSGAT